MDAQPPILLKSSQRVLVIGDSCEDVYHYGSCERLSPEAPIPILNLKRSEVKSGMCLNVAKNLEGLGLVVDVITQTESIKKHRYVEEKRLVHLLRVDEETKVSPLNLQQVFASLKKSDYAAIVISDYNKGFLPFDICKELLNSLGTSIPIFVDSKKQDLSCYENSIIKINQVENKNVKKFPQNYELIITLGELGASWRNNTYSTIASQLFDVCGAGDTFLAGLVFQYLKTFSLREAIVFANKCASISVTHFGNFVLDESHVD